MRYVFVLPVFFFLLVSCSERSDEKTLFTLATGVRLVDEARCSGGAAVAQSLGIQRIANGYKIQMAGQFACEDQLEPPYLTLSTDGKSTLVLMPKRRSLGLSSTCECSRTLSIELKDRLESNQTLYVLYDREVVGHVVVP